MSRWRPPSPGSSPYITASGLEALKAELKELWQVRRPEVVRALSAAAAEGDRSENAEYIYRKKELGEIDRRVRYLSRRVDEVKPVSGRPSDPERVFFGARVKVEEPGGREYTYEIVGADEIDPGRNRISVDSPLARALLGRRLDEEVAVETPAGTRRLLITDIRYPEA